MNLCHTSITVLDANILAVVYNSALLNKNKKGTEIRYNIKN